MSMAFRHVPMLVADFMLLLLKAEHPETGKIYYMVDKCLPFGSSISCTIFQEISNSIAHLVSFRTNKPTLDYLDDYFFAALFKKWCDWQVNTFLAVCDEIKFPVSLEKTYWGTTLLTFLGFLLDTENQRVHIPVEKVEWALNLIQQFLNKKKVTVHEVQKLCGFLNFLCRCIVPGRAFTRRLYAMTAAGSKELKQHHHVKVKQENKLDLEVWKVFLTRPDIFSRPFMDYEACDARDVLLYSDASRSFVRGFEAWCQHSWMWGTWCYQFMSKYNPSIEYLELYAVTAAVLTWIHRFRNRRIYLFCDNESVVHMLNNSSASCKNCMILIRLITLESLCNNVRVYCKHIRTKRNSIADALSRGQMARFHKLTRKMEMDKEMTQIPNRIWPMHKIWVE